MNFSGFIDLFLILVIVVALAVGILTKASLTAMGAFEEPVAVDMNGASRSPPLGTEGLAAFGALIDRAREYYLAHIDQHDGQNRYGNGDLPPLRIDLAVKPINLAGCEG